MNVVGRNTDMRVVQRLISCKLFSHNTWAYFRRCMLTERRDPFGSDDYSSQSGTNGSQSFGDNVVDLATRTHLPPCDLPFLSSVTKATCLLYSGDGGL